MASLGSDAASDASPAEAYSGDGGDESLDRWRRVGRVYRLSDFCLAVDDELNVLERTPAAG